MDQEKEEVIYNPLLGMPGRGLILCPFESYIKSYFLCAYYKSLILCNIGFIKFNNLFILKYRKHKYLRDFNNGFDSRLIHSWKLDFKWLSEN